MNDELVTFYQRSLAARTHMAETLTPVISNAGLSLLQALLEGGKVFSWGSAEGVAIAQLMSSQLLTRYSIERPGLPSICLNNNATLEATIDSYLSREDGHSRLLRSLASPGDVLVVLSLQEIPAVELSLVETAHEKGMTVIYCRTHDSLGPSDSLQENDREIVLPGQSKAIALDSLLFTTQTFNALIDHHLFGSPM